MRIAGLIACSALVAACSQSVGGQAQPSQTLTPDPSSSSTASSPAPSATSPPPSTSQDPRSGAPTPAASIDEVVAWIETGAPVDPADFHVAFRDGVSTRLGEDIAFIAQAGAPNSTTQCIAGAHTMTCLLDLTSPPPPPAQSEGMWKPGWIEFSGTELSVGALRGDPGPFGNGTGAELAAGRSLSFGDTRCRSDSAGLFCVDYAHRAATRIAADGIAAYGCLTEAAAGPDRAALFRC